VHRDQHRRLDRRVEFHPGHVAVVVIIGEEGGGALFQEAPQGWLRRRGGGLAEERGHLHELGLVFDAVGHGHEAAGGVAADRGEEAGGLSLGGGGEGADPGVELVARGVDRIEVAALGFWADAGQEGGEAVEPRPGAGIEAEVVQARAAEGGGVADQLGEVGLVERGGLAEEEGVDDLGGLDQLREGQLLAGRQGGGVRRECDRREAGGHGLERGLIRQFAAGRARAGERQRTEDGEQETGDGGQGTDDGGQTGIH